MVKTDLAQDEGRRWHLSALRRAVDRLASKRADAVIAERRADEDIAQGRVATFETAEELFDDLNDDL